MGRRVLLVGLVATTAMLAGACATRGPASAADRLGLVQRVEHLDVLAREPMVVQHPSGALFVAGYGSGKDALWKSIDGGATWTRVDLGPAAPGNLGNSDVDLAVAPGGTLYFASMHFDRTTYEGQAVAVGASDDQGVTWRWSTVSRHRFDDRPWIEVAPDGTAHLIWNDGDGVQHATSGDGGRSWSVQPRIHGRGGSSHLAIGPRGEIAVRVTPASASGNRFDGGVDFVTVSADGGRTWTDHALPGRRGWSDDPERDGAIDRWVEPLAWDALGALYAAWTEQDGLWLGRSPDRGASWTTWRIAASAMPTFYPYLVARGAGDLVATWFSQPRRGAALGWQVERVVFAAGAGAPRVERAAPQAIEAYRWNEGKGPRVPDTAGEYLAIVALRDGDVGVVTPIQDPPAKRLGFTWWRFGVGGRRAPG